MNNNNHKKIFNIVAWIATLTAILMYISYIPQLVANWNGDKGDYIQPFAAGINCTLWVVYGFFKPERDVALGVANLPGVIFGFLTAALALMNS